MDNCEEFNVDDGLVDMKEKESDKLSWFVQLVKTYDAPLWLEVTLTLTLTGNTDQHGTSGTAFHSGSALASYALKDLDSEQAYTVLGVLYVHALRNRMNEH